VWAPCVSTPISFRCCSGVYTCRVGRCNYEPEMESSGGKRARLHTAQASAAPKNFTREQIFPPPIALRSTKLNNSKDQIAKAYSPLVKQNKQAREEHSSRQNLAASPASASIPCLANQIHAPRPLLWTPVGGPQRTWSWPGTFSPCSSASAVPPPPRNSPPPLPSQRPPSRRASSSRCVAYLGHHYGSLTTAS
jgi:hypothetical protein